MAIGIDGKIIPLIGVGSGVATLVVADTVSRSLGTTREVKRPAQWRENESYGYPEPEAVPYDGTNSPWLDLNEKSLLSIPNPSASWNTLYIGKYDPGRGATTTTQLGSVDNARFNLRQIPGVAKLSVEFSKRIKKIDKAGYDWQDLKDEGVNCKIISARIRMNAVDYVEYNNVIVPILQIKSFNKKSENAILYISNPLLGDYGVSKVILERVVSQTPEVGMVEVTMEFVEFSAISPKEKKKKLPNQGAKGDPTAKPNAGNPENNMTYSSDFMSMSRAK